MGALATSFDCITSYPDAYPVISGWSAAFTSATLTKPVGLVTDPHSYGYGTYHVGEDYGGAAGSEVFAVSDGLVVCVAQHTDAGNFGHSVWVQGQLADGQHVTIVYGHLGSAGLIVKGTIVHRGQTVIGRIGAKSITENGDFDPHLHVGIRPGYYKPRAEQNWPNSGWGYQKGYEEAKNWWSLKALVTSSSADPIDVVGVTVFEHAQYQGRSLTLVQSDENLCDNVLAGQALTTSPCREPTVLTWNDRISSIKVSPGYQAILLLHSRDSDIDQYGQAQVRFACSTDIPDLSARTFDGTSVPVNDNVSKILVERCGASAVPQGLAAAAVNPCGGTPPSPALDGATLVSDVTLPDDTAATGGQALTKSWRVRNTGTSVWDSGYRLVFVRGDRLGAPESVALASTPPGTEVTLQVPLQLPADLTANTYSGTWRLRNASGTYFGPELGVRLKVLAESSTQGHIVFFEASPGSPSSATSVHLVGRIVAFPEFRSMRFIAGDQVLEMPHFTAIGTGQYEIQADWPTATLARGTYALALEVATQDDTGWARPERRLLSYQLTGSPAVINRAPDRPSLQSPYDWYLKDAAGSATTVPLCVYPVSDPDGSAVQYWFELTNGGPSSGWVNGPCWSPTLSPGAYQWRVKASDGVSESGWSPETWNVSVASGGVTIGDPGVFQASDATNTHLCVPVTYGGILAPEVRAWINLAADGTETGAWAQLDHYGPSAAPDCTASNVHGFWLRSVNYATGAHLIRISAVKADSGASATRTVIHTIPAMRPPAPSLAAPATPDHNGTWWNTLSIAFAWDLALRTQSQLLRVSSRADLWNDPAPLVNVALPADATSYVVTFAQDAGPLYWGVRAANASGAGESEAGTWFGIDRVPPTCAVQALAPTYDTTFQVTWLATDAAAGVQSIDVQYQDDARGAWRDWLVSVPVTRSYALFNGQAGHQYRFRCRAVDRAGTAGAYPAAAQASVQVDPAGRPATPWWNAAYAFKRNVVVLNQMPAVALPQGYPVHLRFDATTTPTAADLYDASWSLQKCDDLRVVSQDAVEVSRVVQTCSRDRIDLWFRTSTSVAAGGSNTTAQQLYYGNAAATAPLADPNLVWYPYAEGDTTHLYFLQEGSGAVTADASGNGHTCTLAASVQWADAKWGRGLRFNRANAGDSRSLSCGPFPALGSWTIEFWYRPDADDGGRIAGALAGGGNGGGGNSWLLANEEGHLRLDRWCASGVNCGTAVARSDFDLRDPAYLGTWSHVAVTFNGGNEVRFYLNGALDSVKYLEGNGASPYSPPLEIGSSEGIGQIKGGLGALRISSGVKTSFPYGAFATIQSEPTLAVGAAMAPPVAGAADLAFLDLSQTPNSGGGVTVQAVLQNIGARDTVNGFYTDLYVTAPPSGAGNLANSIRFWVNDPIASGQTVTLTATITDLSGLGGVQALDAVGLTEIVTTLFGQTDSTGAVTEPDNANNITPAGVAVCLAQPDSLEPDDSAGTARSILASVAQAHNLSVAGDFDWAWFTAEAGHTYDFRTSPIGNSADTVLALYAADGVTLLASNDDDGDTFASHVIWQAPQSGRFLVQIRAWDPHLGGCGTSYTLDFGATHWQLYLPAITRH